MILDVRYYRCRDLQLRKEIDTFQVVNESSMGCCVLLSPGMRPSNDSSHQMMVNRKSTSCSILVRKKIEYERPA